MTKEVELAWAAGFFDGEGSVFANHRSARMRKSGKKQSAYLSMNASIHQINIDVLERFIRATGIGVINGPYKPSGIGKKLVYQWNTSGRFNVRDLALKLWPFLSRPKKEQFHSVWNHVKENKTIKSWTLEDLPEID